MDATVPLIDQGVDSLGAVTVTSLFSKQLYLDLPLLKVLGGASVAELAEDAATRLPAASIPLVVAEGDGSTGISDNQVSTDSNDDVTPTTTADDLSEGEDNEDEEHSKFVRREQLSLAQEYSWKQQQFTDDHTIFNNTIGMFMHGAIDFSRLLRAVKTSLRRHEIFRTGFVDDNNETGPEQVTHPQGFREQASARSSI